MHTKIEIAPKTVIFAILSLFGLMLLYLIRDILVLLFIAFILMCAIGPSVDYLERLKFPRLLAAGIMYFIIISILILSGRLLIPPLVYESVHLFQNLPNYVTSLSPYINNTVLVQQLTIIGQGMVKFIFEFFSNILTVLPIAVLTFYFILERRHLRGVLETFVGNEMSERVVLVTRKIENRLGAWVRGEVVLMIVIGIASYIGLTLLHVTYALPLALFAGVLEAVPTIGPIISAIPAILVAWTISPTLALVTLALYFVIQQLENNFIVPAVMNKAVGLPPLAILVALMIGGKLGGTAGLVLAVPMLLVLQTLAQELLQTNKK